MSVRIGKSVMSENKIINLFFLQCSRDGRTEFYFQSTSDFPSWTSRVRSPSPALWIQELTVAPISAVSDNFRIRRTSHSASGEVIIIALIP
jgi:hypothetical protein